MVENFGCTWRSNCLLQPCFKKKLKNKTHPKCRVFDTEGFSWKIMELQYLWNEKKRAINSSVAKKNYPSLHQRSPKIGFLRIGWLQGILADSSPRFSQRIFREIRKISIRNCISYHSERKFNSQSHRESKDIKARPTQNRLLISSIGKPAPHACNEKYRAMFFFPQNKTVITCL